MTEFIFCQKCRGAGKYIGIGGTQKTCPDCLGIGKIEVKPEVIEGIKESIISEKKKPGRKKKVENGEK
jgi:hypothetical protein